MTAFPTMAVDLACVHCGHKSTLSIAVNGTNHNVGFALMCVECPPEKKSQRLGFNMLMKLKTLAGKKSG